MLAGTIADPSTAYLFRPPVEALASESQKQEPVAMLPASTDVDVWEEGGTWSAYSRVLGVTAIADSEAEVYGDFAEQVSEFWDILNERYDTLSEELRQLLDLRGQASFRFIKR
jgi:hypothetical protein